MNLLIVTAVLAAALGAALLWRSFAPRNGGGRSAAQLRQADAEWRQLAERRDGLARSVRELETHHASLITLIDTATRKAGRSSEQLEASARDLAAEIEARRKERLEQADQVIAAEIEATRTRLLEQAERDAA
ncbi:MAG: hypothetical protein HQL39_07580, partial [Alphaproteobacteria bacterium]|nr:hypothetical protein [Alphaproteobacteria bacterium]